MPPRGRGGAAGKTPAEPVAPEAVPVDDGGDGDAATKRKSSSEVGGGKPKKAAKPKVAGIANWNPVERWVCASVEHMLAAPASSPS